MMFLSTNPEEHHEIVLIGGRPDDADYSAAQQLSFLLENLDELRDMRDKLVVAGVEVNRYACHGNAWSIYFHDPEENYLELYVHTPWYVPQPYGVDLDLDESNDEILRKTEALCRKDPGFMMETDRKVEARETMLN
jgi:catechol 2,3-dioxygenase